MTNLPDLPNEILLQVFDYLTPGCIEFLEKWHNGRRVRYILLSSTATANPGAPDRSSFYRFSCNRWRRTTSGSNRPTSNQSAYYKKFYKWQIDRERIPGVGPHRAKVHDLGGLTQRGIANIKTKAVCPCGHCQWRQTKVLHFSDEARSIIPHLFAPFLVCRKLYESVRGLVFAENVFAFREVGDMQRLLGRLAPWQRAEIRRVEIIGASLVIAFEPGSRELEQKKEAGSSNSENSGVAETIGEQFGDSKLD